MKLTCPTISCLKNKNLQKDGHFFRKSDSKFIQRYRCPCCGKRLSTALLSSCYRQKKRKVNPQIEILYVSKVSLRRMAMILNIDKKTVQRKIVFLGLEAKKFNQRYVEEHVKNKINWLYCDDLITKEKSKLLPVSVSMAVDENRHILGFKVSKIRAFGHLAKISRKKYGNRENQHQKNLDQLFSEISPYVEPHAIIRTDMHKTYRPLVKKYFPDAIHETIKGDRSTVAGQGELKRKKYDPIWPINHVFALMRDNMSRLVRRSWCVTQNLEMLEHHLHIYMKFHNTRLIKD